MADKRRQERLKGLMSSQWGLVSAAQAEQLGISRMDLSRMAGAGLLERLLHGVYRDSSVPIDEYTSLHAAWLSLYPKKTAEERMMESNYDAVVCGQTAAWLLDAGDFIPEPYRFATPVRRQTQRPDIRLRTKAYPSGSVVLREGLPVTSFPQTVADLVEQGADLSLVSDMFLQTGFDGLTAQSRRQLIGLLSPLAKEHGFADGDGKAFLDQLTGPLKRLIVQQLKPVCESIGQAVDLTPLCAEISEAVATSPAWGKMLERRQDSVRQIARKVIDVSYPKISPDWAESIAQSVVPSIRAVSVTPSQRENEQPNEE